MELTRELNPATIVLAAGGITDGRGLAAALSLGCDGIVLGTRLWATKEALGDSTGKKRDALLRAEGDDVVRTRTFDAIQNGERERGRERERDSVFVILTRRF